ncbi:DNA glycosylase [Flagelloscypha sp. PMI_526]|nr:DNA glycosylase [Flagelloscypha sp. PMI_526]
MLPLSRRVLFLLPHMSRTLRSSARNLIPESPLVITKRKAEEGNDESEEPKSSKRVRVRKATAEATTVVPPAPPITFVPATLTFQFEDAKAHLIKADSRFIEVFARLPCTPFETLERTHPFRALATSILGQQISWMAARSIKHRFIRLYDPSIPESYADYDSKASSSFFPTPDRVAATDISTLRTAGLSARKAEYIKDLAQQFADGRLSTEKLLAADDAELSEMLVAVRGIGPWTVDMFAIFSLRRPNILPVGDLGVQKGLLHWVLSQHSPEYDITLKGSTSTSSTPKKKGKKASLEDSKGEDSDEMIEDAPKTPPADIADAPSPDASSLVPAASALLTPVKSKALKSSDRPALPPPFTPSIQRVLQRDSGEKPALPTGLSVTELKSRMKGKKKIKGAMLTPAEMEALTEHWKPYRSLGSYYMWSLIDDAT